MDTHEPLVVSLMQLLRRRWLVVLATVVLVVTGGILLIVQKPRSYTSSTDIIVRTQRRSDQVAIDIQTLQTVERLNETIAELGVQRTVLERILKAADLPDGVEALRRKIRATPIPKTELIRISVTDRDPARAQLIAATAATILVQRIQELEQLRESGTSLLIAEPASFPIIPSSSPRRVQAMSVFLFSVFLALIAARMRDLLDVRVRREQDVEALLQLPVIARVPRFRSGQTHLLVARDAFRDLQSSIQFLHRVEPLRALAITGAVAREGKSTIVANLALAFHEAGQDVVLLDLDFRRPSLHDIFHITPAPGATLAEFLREDDRSPIPGPLPTPYEHIRLYLAGEVPLEEVTRFYQSPRLRELVEGLLADSARPGCWVLGDLPPLLLAPGSIAATAVFRNALLVLEPGRARLTHIRKSLALLERGHVNMLGAVLTKLPRVLDEYGAYGYSARPPRKKPRFLTSS